MKGFIVFNKNDDSEVARYSGGAQTPADILSANGFDTDIVDCLDFEIDKGMAEADFSVASGVIVEATVDTATKNLRIANKQLLQNELIIETLLNEINLIRTAQTLPTRSKADIEAFLDSRL